jgi:ABC-2 type transport system ATP-binding protein
MFCGILAPTSGSISVCGFNPLDEREKLSYHIGALFGQTSKLAYHLTPLDSYKLLGKLYDIPNDRLRRRLDTLFAAFEMSDILHLPVRKLSLGQRMRAELVASLVHTPKLLFLDEPTIGLDMVAKAQLRDVINTLNEQEGTTILLTSHDIGDVEQICDRVVIINHGSIVFDGGLHELKRDYVTSKIIRVRFDRKMEFIPKDSMQIIEMHDDGAVFSISNQTTILKDTLSYLIETYPVEDLSITEPDTESIIRNFYV